MPQQIPDQTYFSTQAVVKLVGLSKDTLRYYEKIGVLDPVRRDRNHYRQYTQHDIRWLQTVKTFRSLGANLSFLIGAEHAGEQGRNLERLKQYQQSVAARLDQLVELNRLLKHKLKLLEQNPAALKKDELE